MEYLGRNDHQVKIRGHRVELGEVEAQLSAHPQIRNVAVIAREDGTGSHQLVAYMVLNQSAVAGRDDYRAYLSERLPEYMIPAVFMTLPTLPTTPNGKIDRRSLPAPDPESYLASVYEAPEGDIEEAVAEVWRKLLRLERVGRNSDFFELGGNSLLAMQLVARMESVFGFDIPLRIIFEAPVLRRFSTFVEELRAAHDLEAAEILDEEGPELSVSREPGTSHRSMRELGGHS